jgi:hypothetical protein
MLLNLERETRLTQVFPRVIKKGRGQEAEGRREFYFLLFAYDSKE